MKRKTKKRTAIASLILAGALLVPTQVHALGCSARVSVSRPSVSVSRSTTVRSSVSSRPSSIKSGTSTFKVARGGHVGHASHASHSSHVSHSSRATTHSSKTTVKSSRPTSSKVDSGKFSTKPSTNKSTTKTKIKSSASKSTNKTTIKSNKTTIKSKRTTINVTKHYSVRPRRSIAIVNTHPTYYMHYSATPVVYNRGLSFWDYYMLSNLMESKKQVTDRDIARELESRGYSNSEVDTILKQAKSEQQVVVREEQSFGHKLWNFIKGLIKWTLIIICVALVMLGIAIVMI